MNDTDRASLQEPRRQSTSMTDHSLLRDQHRQEIENLRTSAEERRKKSPSFLSLRSQVSILTDAQLDEDGDIPFPPETTGLWFGSNGERDVQGMLVVQTA